jgi:hypothetical protein
MSTYSSSTKFASLLVSGNFSTDLLQPNTLLVPSLSVLKPVVDYNFETIPVNSIFESKIELLRSEGGLHAFGIFAHDFEPVEI